MFDSFRNQAFLSSFPHRCIPLQAPWTLVWAPWVPWAPSTATSTWTQPLFLQQVWTWHTPAPLSAVQHWPPWGLGPVTCLSPLWPHPSTQALSLSWAPQHPAHWAPCHTIRTWGSPWANWPTPQVGASTVLGQRRSPQNRIGVPWPTPNRHIRTSPLSPWLFSRAEARCSPWMRSTSGSWTCSLTTVRTSSAGKIQFATRCLSTTASWRLHAHQISRAKAPTGLCTQHRAICSRTAATWGDRSASRLKRKQQRKDTRIKMCPPPKGATVEITWGRTTAPLDQMGQTLDTQTTPIWAHQKTSRIPETLWFH